MQRAAPLAALLACAWLAAACGGQAPAGDAPPLAPEDLVREGSHESAVLTLEELGTIRVELLPELAPETSTAILLIRYPDVTTLVRVVSPVMPVFSKRATSQLGRLNGSTSKSSP